MNLKMILRFSESAVSVSMQKIVIIQIVAKRF